MKKHSKVDGHQLGASLDVGENLKDEEEPKESCGCNPPQDQDPKASGKTLITVFSVIVIIFGILIFSYSAMDKEPMTTHEMHLANLGGELDDFDAYVYSGFSFINIEDQWWTEFAKADGVESYEVQFRYGPRETEDVKVIGDYLYILNFPSPYITFDPGVEDIQYTALAAADIATALHRAFKITAQAACTVNESSACATRPIVNCEPGTPVIYLKVANETKVEMDGTCLIIQGKGFEMVRAVDRFLFGVYGIMK